MTAPVLTNRKLVNIMLVVMILFSFYYLLIKPLVLRDAAEREHRSNTLSRIAVDTATSALLSASTAPYGKLRTDPAHTASLARVRESCEGIAKAREDNAPRIDQVHAEMLKTAMLACARLGQLARQREVSYDDIQNLAFKLNESSDKPHTLQKDRDRVAKGLPSLLDKPASQYVADMAGWK